MKFGDMTGVCSPMEHRVGLTHELVKDASKEPPKKSEDWKREKEEHGGDVSTFWRAVPPIFL